MKIKFIIQLGWIEELGLGILNVNKYWQLYGNASKPQFIEGAAFKIILPVSDTFFGSNQDGNQYSNQNSMDEVLAYAINRLIGGGVNGGANDGVNDGPRKEIEALVTIIMSNEGLKAIDIAGKRGKALRTTERHLKLARQYGIIEFRGAPKTGGYFITKSLLEIIEN